MSNLNDIKVSVIMPVYNDEQFVEESIRSVLEQTHSNLELIIVDDCSNDSTIDIIRKKNDPRIKLIVNAKNMGAAYSRNIAIKNASGQYIAFLDGDDKWFKQKLEKQLAFMVKNKYEFSYTKYCVFDYDSRNEIGQMSGPKVISFKKFLRCNYVGCLTVMYKKSIFPNLQISNQIKKRNDYALWILLSKKANCYYLDDCLSSYTKTKNGISGGKKSKLFSSHYQMFKLVLNCSSLKAFLLSVRNVLYFFIKKIRYYKKSSALCRSQNL